MRVNIGNGKGTNDLKANRGAIPSLADLLHDSDGLDIEQRSAKFRERWQSTVKFHDTHSLRMQREMCIFESGKSVPEATYIRGGRSIAFGTSSLNTCTGLWIDGVTIHCFAHILPRTPQQLIQDVVSHFPEDISKIALIPGRSYQKNERWASHKGLAVRSRSFFDHDYFDVVHSDFEISVAQESLVEVVAALKQLDLLNNAYLVPQPDSGGSMSISFCNGAIGSGIERCMDFAEGPKLYSV